jgi:hypothetical protein
MVQTLIVMATWRPRFVRSCIGHQWRILIWRSGLAEGYTMRQCTLPLDQTVDRDSPGRRCEVLHSHSTSFKKKYQNNI